MLEPEALVAAWEGVVEASLVMLALLEAAVVLLGLVEAAGWVGPVEGIFVLLPLVYAPGGALVAGWAGVVEGTVAVVDAIAIELPPASW